MVAAAEAAADRRQGLVGQLAREVHGDLAGEGDAGVRSRASSSSRVMPKASAAASWISSTVVGVGAAVGARVEALEDLAREGRLGLLAAERGVGDDPDQRALERADAAVT